MKKQRLEVAGLSDAGIIKEINQDSFVYKVVDAGEHYAGIFAIADGVGGLEKGELASAIAISNLNKWWEYEFKNHYPDQTYLIESLITMLKTTNLEIIRTGRIEGIKMATTMSVLFIYKEQAIIVHVGDSRIYKVSGFFSPKIQQLSQDHSVNVSREINGRTVQKSVLTDCLGNKEEFKYFSSVEPIVKNEIYILCSDGIYKTMEDKTILAVIRGSSNGCRQICSSLMENAKNNGETDNISIITVRITE